MSTSTVKREKAPGKVQVTLTELIVLQNIDRSRADIAKWWRSLQIAEAINNPNRSLLYDLYERVKLDGRVSGTVQKRLDAILNKNLHYEVNGEKVDEMDKLIESAKFRELVCKLFDKKLYGLSGIEFLVGPEFDFKEINRKHIKPEKGIVTIEQNGLDGYPYNDMWNVLVVEDIERFGLFLKCCPYTIWKSGSIGDLAQYIEIFGQPMRIAKYDGDDTETKAELKQALKESGGSVTLMLPNGATIEILGDHVTNGTGEVHKNMYNICNNEISVIILGNTETTGNENGGSNAKSKEHSKQQLEINKSDLVDIANILSSKKFQTILKSYGLPVIPEAGKFAFEKEIDLEALQKEKTIDQWLSGIVPLDDDYLYEKYGRPKPKNYTALKKKMEDDKKALQKPNFPKPGARHQPDFDFDFDVADDDEPIVKKIKVASASFLKKLKSFFS